MNERLITLRKTLGFKSQKDFAEILDMPARTIQAYEQGTSPNIPSSFLQKLMEQFGISADWLLLGRGDMFSKNNFIIKSFENCELLYDELNNEEIYNALVGAYIEKKITPLFRDLGAEKSFWKQMVYGHRDRIGAIFILLRILQETPSTDINVNNAKEALKTIVERHMITLKDHIQYVYLNKENLLKAIDELDDIGCFLILSNAPKIAEALSPFLKNVHIKALEN